MKLTDILDACQGERADDWRHEPDEPEGAFLHRATYRPDKRLVLDWGMNSEEELEEPEPEWADPGWSNVIPQWAHVRFDGEMVWRVKYAYINRGAGADGYMPWLKEDLEPVPGDPLKSRRIGWSTTTWRLSIAALLNSLQGNAWDFDVDRERRWKSLLVHDISPLDED